ncbi:UNVERIFIED_CONTAM: hypothetical protein K2H54_051796 [Gekko kuhli]
MEKMGGRCHTSTETVFGLMVASGVVLAIEVADYRREQLGSHNMHLGGHLRVNANESEQALIEESSLNQTKGSTGSSVVLDFIYLGLGEAEGLEDYQLRLCYRGVHLIREADKDLVVKPDCFDVDALVLSGIKVNVLESMECWARTSSESTSPSVVRVLVAILEGPRQIPRVWPGVRTPIFS